MDEQRATELLMELRAEITSRLADAAADGDYAAISQATNAMTGITVLTNYFGVTLPEHN